MTFPDIARQVSLALAIFIVGLTGAVPGAWASDLPSHTQRSEKLSVHIRDIPKIVKSDLSVFVGVEVANLQDKEVRGKVVIGGPTQGIYPVGEIEQEFVISAGSTHSAVFRIAFDSSCRSGWYPIHAFVGLSEAVPEVLHAVRLVETDFVDEEPWPVVMPSTRQNTLVSWTPEKEIRNSRRIQVLMDYVRSAKDFGESLAFPLGEESGYKVMVVPGTKGMLDGVIGFVGPEKQLFFHGLHLAIEAPPGLETEGVFEVVDFEISKRSEGDGLDAKHRIHMGGFATEAVIQLRTLNGALSLEVVSPDRVAAFSVGSSGTSATAITAGTGYRFPVPDFWQVSGPSSVLAMSQLGVDYSDGMTLLQASDQPLEEIGVRGNERLARAVTSGKSRLFLVPSEDSIFDAALTYRLLNPPLGSPGANRLMGRLWIEDSALSAQDAEVRIQELSRYGGGKSALLLRNWQSWQASGSGSWPPDSWPPRVGRGSIEKFQQLGQQCRGLEVLWGLADNYASIDPRSTSFDFGAVCFDQDGMPVPAGIADAEHGIQYRLRPDQVAGYLKQNLSEIGSKLEPSLVALGGLNTQSYFDRDGGSHSPAKARQAWRQVLEDARVYLGDNSTVTALGGGDWLLGGADAYAVDPKPAEIPWNAKRVPWRSLLQGEETMTFTQSADLDFSSDEVLVSEILEGRLPQGNQLDWGRSLVRKAWLAQTVHLFLNGKQVDRVRRLDEDWAQLRLLWSDGSVLWTNLSEETWTIANRDLPPNGFMVKGRDFDAAIEIRDGIICEQVQAPGFRYANARPRHERFLQIAPSITKVSQVSGNRLRFEMELQCEEAVPGNISVLLLGNGEILDEHISLQAAAWNGKVEFEREAEIPAAETSSSMELAVALKRPDGRFLNLVGTPIHHPGSSLVGAVRCGDLQMERGDDGSLGKVSFEPVERIPMPSNERINPIRKTIDFEWTQTNGAFGLIERENGWRLIPLPDSLPFEVILPLNGRKVKGILAEALFAEGTEPIDPEVEGDVLKLEHSAKWFAYDIQLD